VATGVAQWRGLDPTIARMGFVLGSLATGGWLLAVYVVAWLFVPAEGEETNIASRAVSDRRGLALALTVASGLVVVWVISSAAGLGWLSSFAIPLFTSIGGLVLIWRNASDDERAHLDRAAQPFAGLNVVTGRSFRVLAWRAAGGFALVAGGIAAIVIGHPHIAVLRPLSGILLMLAGFVVIFGPWWLRVARDLSEERRARARAEERADMAARVHDSVMQTLVLIQRQADDPAMVRSLARTQERELRSWLLDGRPPGSLAEDTMSLDAALQQVVREVEDAHQVPIELVVVGDCTLDDDLRELVAAGREATVNAAKWSGAPTVSLYAEVEPEAVSIFVRDRGKGFAPEEIGADRRGVSESIRGRVARHGGQATVRTTLGQGTEIALVMPRGARRGAKAGDPVS
jgi:signal transduction histidine kinase